MTGLVTEPAGKINPHMSNVFYHPYRLDESISNFRVFEWYFLVLFKF